MSFALFLFNYRKSAEKFTCELCTDKLLKHYFHILQVEENSWTIDVLMRFADSERAVRAHSYLLNPRRRLSGIHSVLLAKLAGRQEPARTCLEQTKRRRRSIKYVKALAQEVRVREHVQLLGDDVSIRGAAIRLVPGTNAGKCAKMIPVMIRGYFINQKRYTLIECAIAACVTFGCMIFGLFGDLTHKHSVKSSNTGFKGLLLILGYLVFDGFTSKF
jgi:hypothetical protein